MSKEILDSNPQFKSKSEISVYVDKKINGVSYSEIRKELSEKGYSDDNVSAMIKEIDDIVLKEEFNSSISKRFPIHKIAGLILITLGVVLILVFQGIGIIQGALVLSGLVMFASGSRFRKKPNPRSRKFNR